MKKVYVSGALTNTPNPEELKMFYEGIGKVLVKVGLDPYIPHLHTDPIKNGDITPAEVFRTDKTNIKSSDMVIAYIGTPSLGVGMEIAYAEDQGIPLIIMYEKGQVVSRFPRGVPTIIKEIQFSTYKEGLEELERFLLTLHRKKNPEEDAFSFTQTKMRQNVL